MRNATITSSPSTDEGTFGKYESDSGFSASSLELAWLDNAAEISCIPAGEYLVTWAWSKIQKSFRYHIQNVPGRSNTMFHPGNVAGKVSLGFASQVEGCVLLGADEVTFPQGARISEKILLTKPQRGVSSSGPTITAFEKDMQDADGNQQDFMLKIVRASASG